MTSWSSLVGVSPAMATCWVLARTAAPSASRLAQPSAPVTQRAAASAVGHRGELGTCSAAAAAFAGGAAAGLRRSRRRGKQVQRRDANVAVAEKPTTTDFDHETLCSADDAPDSMRRRFEAVVAEAQHNICKAIEEVDGKAKFCYDRYLRDNGEGGGIARVLKDGKVFEKAGVNLSVVYGEMPQEALAAANDREAGRSGKKMAKGEKVPFFACGLSSVMHPRNPFCPTMHFNYRYFETSTGVFWFGGGTDITPSYLDEEDMKHFHGVYKKVCDEHNPEYYPRFKKWADEYFCIKHRGETRGLGGIFFDDFNSEDLEEHLSFSEDCLKAVTEAYVPILEKNKTQDFTEEQKRWQQLRRGRYAEFNLVYDRGTVFGLKMLSSGAGRIESILMSLPETARWEYCHEPEPDTPEAEIMEVFKNPRDWA